MRAGVILMKFSQLVTAIHCNLKMLHCHLKIFPVRDGSKSLNIEFRVG